MGQISRNEARKRKHTRIKNKILKSTDLPRINVFKSLKNMEAQLINDAQNKTLVHSSTIKLKLKNGGNKAAAKKLGEDFGEKLKAAKIKEVVFDRSGYIYHGRVKEFAEAVREKGVKF